MKYFTLLLTFFLFQWLSLQAQNNALQFNNDVTQDYVSIPDDVALHFGTGTFTFEAQVKVPTGNTNDVTIMSNRTSGNFSTGFWIRIGPSGKLSLVIGGYISTEFGPDLRDGSCHHLAVVRDVSSNVYMYVDGVQSFSYFYTSNITNVHPLWLGRDDYAPANTHFKGVMDEVRIWNITRTAAEINLYKNNSVSISSTGLVAYYQFNQGLAGGVNTSINTLTDVTAGNIHTGSLQNFALSGNVSNWVAQCSSCTTSAGNDTTVCALSNIILNGTPSGGVWMENGNTISSSYTVPFVTGSTPVNHTLTYTVSGCIDTMIITAMPKPNAGNDTTICANTTISIPIVSSAAILSYWTFDGVNVGNVNTYTSTSLGLHTLIYTSGGCKDTLKINVLAKPNAGSDTSICANSTISLASSPVTNNWTDNGVNLGSINSYTGVVVGTHTMVFTSAGCKDTMMIYVLAKPNAGNDTTICMNTSISIPFNSNAAILSYWTFDGVNVGNVNTYTGSSIGTHTLIYTSAGCKDTVLVNVVAKPNAGADTTICKNTTINLTSLTSGNWTDNGTSIGNTSLYTGTVVGTHTMIYTVGSCKDTMMIYVVAKPNAGNDTTICANTTISIPFNSNAAIQSYWTFDGVNVGNINTYTGSSIGTHTLIYTSAGCKDTVLVNVVAKPNAGADTTICKNTTINLTSLTSGNWTDNGTSIGNTSLYTGTVVGTHTMIYTVGSCKDTMMIYVVAKPNAGNDTTICANTTISIPFNSNAAIQSYWTFDGVNVGNINTYTGTSLGTHTLIYTSAGCKDTVLVIVRAKPFAGMDTTICTNKKDTLIGNPSGGIWTEGSNTITGNMFSSSVAGNHILIYSLNECKDTLVINVTDTCATICNYFKLDVQDSNCCRAGIIRNIAGGPNVVAVKYSVIGGVMQGYTTNCPGGSTVPSGSVSGTVNFTPACANMQLFNTALQSTTSTGSMTVTYTVKYATGDSCTYTVFVKGCPRAPHGLCDSIKVQLCACPNALLNYFNINISNLSMPASPICSIKFTKYNTSNIVEPNFFTNGYFVTPFTNISTPNSTITSFPSLVNYGSNTNMQMYFPNSPAFSGYIRITVVHCNGDTCNAIWSPTVIGVTELKYADYTIKKGANPYNKLFAYTFKISGPSKNRAGSSPYKLKYITVSIMDSVFSAEIAGLTGAEMYNEKERSKFLKFSMTSHARHNALLELSSPLEILSNDSSGVFQIFFANALPKELLFSCYDNSGSVLSSGTLALDSTGNVGVMKLGKTSEPIDQLMIFNGFPNPTSGRYNIKISLPENDNISLHVFDISGKEVYVYNLGSMNNGLVDGVIDLGILDNGSYFINAVSQKQGTVSNAIKVILMR